MNKGILIVGYPGKIGDESYCEGVNVDLEEYKKFFLSEKGGAWNHNEITVLNSPRKYEVTKAINALDEMDYSIVVFSGHGAFNCDYDATVMVLNDNGEECNEHDFRNAKNRTIILDCCREPDLEPLVESFNPLMNTKESLAKSPQIREEIRKRYEANIEQLIRRENVGIVTTYACSVGETAGDYSDRGGIYSYNLIRVARHWKSSALDIDFRSIVGIHADASTAVTRMNQEQHPSIFKSRSGLYYPFAVSYYFGV